MKGAFQSKMEMLKDILLNKWFLSFVAGWIVFFALVDFKKININIWGGIAALILQLVHDTEGTISNFYHIHDAGLWILKSSFFFTFGLVFTMGVIFSQFIPKNPKLKLLHILIFAAGFLFFELIALKNGMLTYIHYSFSLSVADDVLVTLTLVWTKGFVLYIHESKRREH